MTRRPDTFSQAIADPAVQRRGLATALTALVHAGLLAIILTVPVYDPPAPRGESGGSIDVRLYTVAGQNAETDAPLNEPSLAERTGQTGSADTAGQGDGGDSASDEPAIPQTQAQAAEPVETPAEEPPATESPAEVPAETAPPDPAVETEPAADTTLLTAPGSGNRGLDSAERPASPPAPAPGAAADAGEPVATTQIRRDGETLPAAPPSFADILAQADPSLDPADFRVGTLDGDLDGAVRESLCLASSQATLDAARCPEGPNPDQAALAVYGLTEPGEAPPHFMVDMDRLAFQLAQMGTDPGVIEQLMLGFSEARREAVRAPTIERMMGRDDLQSGRDNLGIHNPFGKDGMPMPDNPEG